MKRAAPYLPLLLFLGLAIFLWRGLHHNPHQLQSPLIGKPVPSFIAPDLWNPNHDVTQALFNGHVSVLNVFASWCEYCLQEQSIINAMADTPDVVIYGLNYKDRASQAQQWLQRYGNPFKAVIFDPHGQVAIDLGVYGTPETFIIDEQGIIRYKTVGPVTQALWEQVMKPMIEQHSWP